MLEALLKKLNENGFDSHFVESKKEALMLAKSFISTGVSVGLGGSVSVAEVGLLEDLTNNKEITLFNQYEKGISMQENTHRRRQGLLADVYVTGCNAITKNGELANADGSGNRVAAMIFGPKKVVVIAGVNKIVENLDDAFKRIMEVAATKNIERMNQKAIEMGKEARYNYDNIANKFSYINGDEIGRISIILVNETLGY